MFFWVTLAVAINLSSSQSNWRQVYLDDPKGILSASRRNLVDYEVEFADLGYEYEVGSIWPKPKTEMRYPDITFTFSPKKFSFKTNASGNSILKNAVSRYQEITFPNKEFNPENNMKIIEKLQISIVDEDNLLSMESDESYNLTIGAPDAILAANTVWGALRGLESFSQAVYQNGSTYRVAQNQIEDEPRFKFRGFLIDTSRHYIPLPKIFQVLDAMAYSKFNVLHWHIVDDNSFPYVSKKFPELHKKGAFTSTHVYTPDDVQDVIMYAKLRGIRVMPEFDTPGHTHSWSGQPGLLTECGMTKQQELYFRDLKGPINPIKEGTYEFLEELFQEVDEVFPDDYVHLGGDEVDFTCWDTNKKIQDWLKKRPDSVKNGTTLHTYYLQRLVEIVAKLNKKYIVWQDVFDDGVKMDKNTIVNVWKDKWKKPLERATKAGYKAILSSCWYLNYIKYGLDWPTLYRCDPQDFNGNQTMKDLVIGGSAAIWGEYVDATNIIQRSFGRAFAVAERLWSSKDVTDVEDAMKRLWEHQCRYIIRGIPAEPVVRSKFCRVEWGMNFT